MPPFQIKRIFLCYTASIVFFCLLAFSTSLAEDTRIEMVVIEADSESEVRLLRSLNIDVLPLKKQHSLRSGVDIAAAVSGQDKK